MNFKKIIYSKLNSRQQGLPKAVDRLPFEPELEELPESPLETFIPGFHD